MDDRGLRRSPVRWANPARRTPCAHRKSLPRPHQSRAASSETSARIEPAASPPPTPDGGRMPYPRIAWESSFLIFEKRYGGNKRKSAACAHFRASRSTLQPAELKDGSHRQDDRLSRNRTVFKVTMSKACGARYKPKADG